MTVGIEWQDAAPLGMAQSSLSLSYRVPSPERPAWSKEKVAESEGCLPQLQSEVYAYESVYLREKQHTALFLQALRIGDLGITALPNEVYAGPYSETVLESNPEAYWRLEEMNMLVARDVTGQHDGAFEDGVALYLPGSDERAVTGYAYSGGLVVSEPLTVDPAVIDWDASGRLWGVDMYR